MFKLGTWISSLGGLNHRGIAGRCSWKWLRGKMAGFAALKWVSRKEDSDGLSRTGTGEKRL